MSSPSAALTDASKLKKANTEIGFKLTQESRPLSFVGQKIHNTLVCLAQKGKKGAFPCVVKHEIPNSDLYWWSALDDVIFGANIAKDGSGSRMEKVESYLKQLKGVQVDRRHVGENTIWELHSIIGDVMVVNSASPKRGQRGGTLLIGWNFGEVLERHILDPERNYTWLALKYQGKLPNSAALNLWEYCKQFESFVRFPGDAPQVKLSIDEWDAILRPGREAPIEYKYFRRDVFNKAVDAVNSVTDISLEVEASKSPGSRVTDQIRVIISKNPQANLELPALPGIDLILLENLEAIGVPEAVAVKLIEKEGEEKVKAALSVVTARQANTKLTPLENPGAYFRKALDQDYAAGEKTKKTIAEKKAVIGEQKYKALKEQSEGESKKRNNIQLPEGDDLVACWATFKVSPIGKTFKLPDSYAEASTRQQKAFDGWLASQAA